MKKKHQLLSVDEFCFLQNSVIERIQKLSMDRRIPVSDIPDLKEEVDVKAFENLTIPKKYWDEYCLIILCWSNLNLFYGFEGYILYELETYQDGLKQNPELAAAASEVSLAFLILFMFGKKFSEKLIFSSILSPSRIKRVIQSVQLRYCKNRKARRPVFRRGYRDHGTLRPVTKWLPDSDFSFTEEQNQLELKKNEYFSLKDLYIKTAKEIVTQKTFKLNFTNKEEL